MKQQHYCVAIILAIYVTKCWAVTCPTGIETLPQPQLSDTFLDGYWYEHFYATDALNNNSCSHFQIKCPNGTACEIQHAIWNSYLLTEIWNGSIVQTENEVRATINLENETLEYQDVQLRFEGDAVLIWTCNNENDLSFASVLVRMDDDEEMEKIWGDATINTKYFHILRGFPAGIWKKIDALKCMGGGAASFKNQPHLFPGLTALLILVLAHVG